MRFDCRVGDYVESPKIDEFMEKVNELCREYKYHIGHEDIHGSFVIWDLNNDEDLEWLNDANIDDTLKGEI